MRLPVGDEVLTSAKALASLELDELDRILATMRLELARTPTEERAAVLRRIDRLLDRRRRILEACSAGVEGAA